MDGLIKVTFKIPGDVLDRLLYTSYERVGGIVRDPVTGKIVFLLRDQAEENYSGSALTVRVPEMLSATLDSYTFAEFAYKFNKCIVKDAKEIDSEDAVEYLQKLENGFTLVSRTLSSQTKVTADSDIARAGELLLESFNYFKDLFNYNLGIVDKRTDLKSFPVLKLCIFISVCLAKVFLTKKQYELSCSWVERAYDLSVTAMKKYPAIHCKHIKDVEHYVHIANLPAKEFIRELKEIIMSPAGKPKIKFPPMEVIYLWNCIEYIEGYQIEIMAQSVQDGKTNI